MKTFAVAVLLLCSSAAWSGTEHPQPPRPECVNGDAAKDTFDKLDVEPKVITHDKVTITIKRSKGVVCREIASEEKTEYTCCVRPEPKPGEPKPDEGDSL